MRVVSRRKTWLESIEEAGASKHALHMAAILESLLSRHTSLSDLGKKMGIYPVATRRAYLELRALGALERDRGELVLRNLAPPTHAAAATAAESAEFGNSAATQTSDSVPLCTSSCADDADFGVLIPHGVLSERKNGVGILGSSYSELEALKDVPKEEELRVLKSTSHASSGIRDSADSATSERGRKQKFYYGDIIDAYCDVYGAQSDGDYSPQASNAKSACDRYGPELVCAALRFSSNDEWVKRKFLAQGEVPALGVLLSHRVLEALVGQVTT